MKKIILTALVAVASLSANAQVWLGGSLGFNYTKQSIKGGSDASMTTFTISPEVGYSLSDKWDIALAINESLISVKDGDTMNSFTINPYARYTYYTTGKVGFFLDLGFTVGTTNLGSDDEDSFYKTDDNATTWGIGVRPGVKYAASDKVTFVASLGLLGFEQYKLDDYKVSSFGNGLIAQRIDAILNDTQYLCDNSFNLNTLVQLTGSNIAYVSKIINEKYNNNFRSVLNERRVKLACEKMDDVEYYGNLTISAIAEKVGYKSSNSFINAFKKVMNTTPYIYQQQAIQQHLLSSSKKKK